MAGNQNEGLLPLHNLLDWRFLVALLALAVNDHWAKDAFPGLITGKVSDLAGMVVLPVILSVLYTMVRGQATTQRSTNRLALLSSGAFLLAIKTIPAAASLVESALGVITGFRQEILVDPTDLIGLVALAVAHRVLCQPQPIPSRALGRVGPKLVLGFGVLALTATSSETDYGWIRLETREDLVIASTGAGYWDSISSRDSGRTWDPYQVDLDATQEEEILDRENWNPEQGPICLAAQSNTCVRLALGAIQESNDGGKTWAVKWKINTSEYWVTDTLGYDVDINASDILLLQDGTVIVAVGAHNPVRRDAQSGLWSPSIADIRTVPWEMILVAISFQLPAIGGIRRFRAGHDRGLLYLLGAVIIGLAGLMAAIDVVGPGAFVGGTIAILGSMAMVLTWMSEKRDTGVYPAVLSAPLGPLTVCLLLATTVPFLVWAQDKLEWPVAVRATWIVTIAGSLILGFVGRPTLLASAPFGPQPAPPTSLTPSLDQPPPPSLSLETAMDPSPVWSNRTRTSVGFRLVMFVGLFAVLFELPARKIIQRFGYMTPAGVTLLTMVLGLALFAMTAIIKSGRQRPTSMPLRVTLIAVLLIPLLFRFYIPPLGRLIHLVVLVIGVPLVALAKSTGEDSNGTRTDAPPQPDLGGPPAPPGRARQLHQ